ncbi:MAG: ZIP family metal transporter [Halothermotrichaceae bacterium]
MSTILYITFIGIITGVVGTLSGSIFVMLVKKIDEEILTLILGMSAGIMTVVVFLDLIPEALEMGTTSSTLGGMLFGILLISLVDFIFPHEHSVTDQQSNYYKVGLLLAVGIALHNIPEGLAIGAGYSAANSLGLGLAIIIGIHNAPEGMAVATSLSLAGLKNTKIGLITILAGIPMGVGTFIGSYLGNISDFFLSLSLGFAAGAMLFITFDDLIPAAHKNNNGNMAVLGILLGVFLGIFITNQF